MPRFYIRKRTAHGATLPEEMKKAVEAVANGMKVREAARQYGIPRSTLQHNIEKAKSGAELRPNYQNRQIFSPAEEAILAEYLDTCAKMFYGLTTQNLRNLAYEMAVAFKISHPSQWDENKTAGKEWMMGFMRRNPRLSIRQPEATSYSRATAFNRHTVGIFFTLLEKTYREVKITGAQIFNLDETGITTVHKVPKVVGPRGIKQMGQITSGERGELVTMCCVISAVGQSLPPVFVST
jgi:transposase